MTSIAVPPRPDSRCTKFNATRSAVRIDRAGPSTRRSGCPAFDRPPSLAARTIRTVREISRKTASARGRPAATSGSRATIVAFEVTPEGHYEVVYSACIGCGICAQVCPVKDCIVMVDELKFTDNVDKWKLWKDDKPTYNAWFEDMSGVSADPKKANLAANPATSSGNANPAANPTTSAGGDD
jgi:ferredoxin